MVVQTARKFKSIAKLGDLKVVKLRDPIFCSLIEEGLSPSWQILAPGEEQSISSTMHSLKENKILTGFPKITQVPISDLEFHYITQKKEFLDPSFGFRDHLDGKSLARKIKFLINLIKKMEAEKEK